MNIKELLKTLIKIGLTENESQVYLTLIATGSSSPSSVSKACGVKRTTTYSVLSQLLDRGLVKKEVHDGKEFFVALSLNQIIEKQHEIIRSIQDAIPTLMRFRRNLEEKPNIEIFESNDYLEKTVKNILQAEDQIFSWIDPHFSPIVKNESLYFKLTRDRVKRQIFQKSIIANNLSSNKFKNADKIANRISNIASYSHIAPEIHIINNFCLLIYKDIDYTLKITCDRFTSNMRAIFLSEWNALGNLVRQEAPSVNANELQNRFRIYSNQKGLVFYKNDISTTIQKIKDKKINPKETPIPEYAYDFSFENYRSIGVESSLRDSKLENFLKNKFKGISYFHSESENNPIYQKNFKEAEKGVFVRDTLLASLKSVNLYLKEFGLEIYLLDGYRSLSFQKKIWERLLKNALGFYQKTSSSELADKMAKKFTSQVMHYPPTKVESKLPSTWFTENTGGNILLTLVSKSGYPQDLGNLHLNLSEKSETRYFEKFIPKNDSEKIIQTNRRLLFWSMAINGWFNNPSNIYQYNICDNNRTQLGIFSAKLWGINETRGANIGPASSNLK